MQITCNGKTLTLGEDDDLIQSRSRDNLIDLEEDHKTSRNGLQTFVVTRETIAPPPKRKTPVSTIDVHCIIDATDMWEALQIFHSEHRKRIWISEKPETRGDRQVGLDRSTNRGKTEVMRIYRMRKDQRLQKEQ